MPNACVPAAGIGLPSPLRRRLLLCAATASALLATPVAAQEPHPDAALLAYAPRLAELKAEIDRCRAALSRVSGVHDAMIDPRPDRADPAFAAWLKRWRLTKNESGYDAAEAALDNAIYTLDRALRELAKIEALTLEGLCLKARYGHDYDVTIENIVADLVAIDQKAQA